VQVASLQASAGEGLAAAAVASDHAQNGEPEEQVQELLPSEGGSGAAEGQKAEDKGWILSPDGDAAILHGMAHSHRLCWIGRVLSAFSSKSIRSAGDIV
jgi:hypothetical protein